MRFLLLGYALLLTPFVFIETSGAQEPTQKQPEAPYVERQTGLTFPTKIGNLKFDSAKDFGDPQLGIGVRYRSPDGLQVDAIIYNQGLKTISADPADPRVKQEAEQALSDIQTAADRGLYKDLKVISREIVPLSKAADGPKAHQLTLSFTLADKPRQSTLYLLVHENHFVKIRATWLPETMAASEKELTGLLEWLAGEMK